MKSFDLNRPITSKDLNESMFKQFNVKINFDKYTREELENYRNLLRTKVHQTESQANFNDLLTNETYQKDKFMLGVLNTRIKEMLGEGLDLPGRGTGSATEILGPYVGILKKFGWYQSKHDQSTGDVFFKNSDPALSEYTISFDLTDNKWWIDKAGSRNRHGVALRDVRAAGNTPQQLAAYLGSMVSEGFGSRLSRNIKDRTGNALGGAALTALGTGMPLGAAGFVAGGPAGTGIALGGAAALGGLGAAIAFPTGGKKIFYATISRLHDDANTDLNALVKELALDYNMSEEDALYYVKKGVKAFRKDTSKAEDSEISEGVAGRALRRAGSVAGHTAWGAAKGAAIGGGGALAANKGLDPHMTAAIGAIGAVGGGLIGGAGGVAKGIHDVKDAKAFRAVKDLADAIFKKQGNVKIDADQLAQNLVIQFDLPEDDALHHATRGINAVRKAHGFKPGTEMKPAKVSRAQIEKYLYGSYDYEPDQSVSEAKQPWMRDPEDKDFDKPAYQRKAEFEKAVGPKAIQRKKNEPKTEANRNKTNKEQKLVSRSTATDAKANKKTEKTTKMNGKGKPVKESVRVILGPKARKSTFNESRRHIAESVAYYIMEDEEGKAKAITAASDMVNDFTSWMQRVGNYQTKSMIELADNIRSNFGVQESETFKQAVGSALEGALSALTTAREEINNAVSVLAGEAPAEQPMGPEPEGDAGLDMSGPDQMNVPVQGADEFAASDAAAGGPETLGRMRRESIERGNRLMRILGS